MASIPSGRRPSNPPSPTLFDKEPAVNPSVPGRGGPTREEGSVDRRCLGIECLIRVTIHLLETPRVVV